MKKSTRSCKGTLALLSFTKKYNLSTPFLITGLFEYMTVPGELASYIEAKELTLPTTSSSLRATTMGPFRK